MVGELSMMPWDVLATAASAQLLRGVEVDENDEKELLLPDGFLASATAYV